MAYGRNMSSLTPQHISPVNYQAQQQRKPFDAHVTNQIYPPADHAGTCWLAERVDYQQLQWPVANQMPLSQLAGRHVGGLNVSWDQIRSAYYARC